MIYYFKPYSAEGRLGKAYNQCIEVVPNDTDHVCILDGDTMFLTQNYGTQIQDIVDKYPEVDLFTCYCSRTGKRYLRPDFANAANPDIRYHSRIAYERQKSHYDVITKLDKPPVGYFMLFRKSLWNELGKFSEVGILGPDLRFTRQVLALGKNVALMEGVYIYHKYRLYEGFQNAKQYLIDNANKEVMSENIVLGSETGKYDVVIPLGKGSINDNLELRIALRSLEKNFKELGNIFIVTQKKPEWLDDTKAIVLFGDDLLKSNKDGNLISKVLIACKDERLSTIFLRMSDDQFISSPITIEDIKPYSNGNLVGRRFKNTNLWHLNLQRTKDLLVGLGRPALNYETHMPMPYNKNLFPEIMGQFECMKDREGYTINTLYFNNLDNIETVKSHSVKTSFERPSTQSDEDIVKTIQSKKFCGYNNKAFNEKLKSILLNMFPEKSKYELTDYKKVHKEEPKISPDIIKNIMDQEKEGFKDTMFAVRKLLNERIAHNIMMRSRLMLTKLNQFDIEELFINDIVSKIEDRFSITDLKKYEQKAK